MVEGTACSLSRISLTGPYISLTGTLGTMACPRNGCNYRPKHLASNLR